MSPRCITGVGLTSVALALSLFASGCSRCTGSGGGTENGGEKPPVSPPVTPPIAETPGPPKPPIIIRPGDDANWLINDQNAVEDTTMTGNKLNECAFGGKSSFYAIVETPDNPSLQVSLVSADIHFPSSTLQVSVDGSGLFVWTLGGTTLVPYQPSDRRRWRSDLMTSPTSFAIFPFNELQQPYTVKGIATKANGNCVGPQ